MGQRVLGEYLENSAPGVTADVAEADIAPSTTVTFSFDGVTRARIL